MLEDSLLDSQANRAPRKRLTVVVSALAHVGTLIVLIVIPLLRMEALTIRPVDASLWLPRTQSPKPVSVFAAAPRIVKTDRAPSDVFTSPQAIPAKIARIDAPPAAVPEFVLAGGSGAASSSLIGLSGLQPEIVPPAALPEPPAAPSGPPPVIKTELLRQGGNVQAAKLTYQVKPIYPELAIRARIQGVVTLEAIISREGMVDSLRVISGHPLLNQAALDAVKQWRYRPTLLNGEPVAVVTNVTVTFALQ